MPAPPNVGTYWLETDPFGPPNLDGVTLNQREIAFRNYIAEAHTAVDLRQLLEEKGDAFGYAPLDGDAKVPAANLPAVVAGSSSGHRIIDEGTVLAARGDLAFVGGGVTARDDSASGRTVVEILGGGGAQASPGTSGPFVAELGTLAGPAAALDFVQLGAQRSSVLFVATLSGPVTFTLQNFVAGCEFVLWLSQDGIGGRTATFRTLTDGTIRWADGASGVSRPTAGVKAYRPTLSAAAFGTDIVSGFTRNGVAFDAAFRTNFQEPV